MAGSRFNAAAITRCAIYTRKSSEEGLEQEFNSLHGYPVDTHTRLG